MVTLIVSPHRRASVDLRWWLATVCAVTFMAALGCSEDLDDLARARTSKIAFVSDRDGYKRIYLMDADGSDQRPLTDPTHGEDTHPVWSPDGRQIAFMSNQDGDPDIYVVDADGSNRRNITDSRDRAERSPTWSPDGVRVAFSRGYDSVDTLSVALETTEVTTISVGGLGGPRLVWSPDGATFAYQSGPSFDDTFNTAVVLIDADGENRRVVGPSVRQWLTGGSPAWSPNGHWLAIRAGDRGHDWITIMDAQGESRRALTGGAGTRHDWPAWSPDGSSVVFMTKGVTPDNIHTRQGWQRSDIWVVDLDDLSTRQLTNSRDYDGMPSWSPWLMAGGEE